ncbi:MAG: putative Ig domain-containing protein [Acidobacteria bacterium]|nr:putative Ig domain-containing protein [Acidobacteriota bacterium]
MHTANGLSQSLSLLLGKVRQHRVRVVSMLSVTIAAGFLLGHSLTEARRNEVVQAPFGEPASAPNAMLAPATITVNDTGDTIGNNGKCTLREAITAANTNTASGAAAGECIAGMAGADIIVFSLGSGTPTINLTSALPTITEPLTIKGNSGGATRVELNGAGAGAGANGLNITAGSSTILRLVINRFNSNGILISGSGANTIKGCLIGTNGSGTATSANAVGIKILGASNNTIGGTAPGERNLISGNTGAGVLISYDTPNSLAASGNQVIGNFIGPDANGKIDLGNGGFGVDITGGSNSTIGGVTTESRNIISGNTGGGVGISTTNATGNVVIGNLIGTDISSIAPLGNSGIGVLIDAAFNNRIGGLGVPCPADSSMTCSQGNTIRFNNAKGVVVKGNSAIGNPILGNIISDNNGLGIDLAENGVTPFTVPGAPTDVTATAGNAQATVSFCPPASNGGSLIYAYTVTSSPGGITASGLSSPITVTGLTNGTAYTFTVKATNFVGTGPASTPSNSVTPMAPPFADPKSANEANAVCPALNAGPNSLQNSPVLTGVSVTAGNPGSSTISGYLYSSASTTFRIEFFINPLCDSSGNGEGLVLIGSTNVTTSPLIFNDNTSGFAGISKTLDYALPGGYYVTATATRLNAGTPVETSEFSGCRIIPFTDSGCDKQTVTTPGVTSFSAAGGSTAFYVTYPAIFCSPSSVQSSDSWIQITSNSSSSIGDGRLLQTIGITIQPNTGAIRFGTIKIAGTDYSISQDAPCTTSISPLALSFPAPAVSSSLNLYVPAGCPWTVTNFTPWVTVTTQTSGSGPNVTDFTLEANPGPTQRVAVLIVGGQSIIITQDAPCTAYLSPASQNFTAAGGSNSLTLTVGAACPWTAVASDPWINITTVPLSGSGNATFNYTVAANTGGQRSGTISVAGKSLVINQEASCPSMISPGSQSFMSTGGSGSIAVTIGAACPWTAGTNDSWIHITSGASGMGNGTVNFTVDSNPGGQRSGTIVAAGQNFIVQQSSFCTYSVSPSLQPMVVAGGTASATVTAGATCAWTATPSDPWIKITSGGSGTGNGTVNYSVGTNGTGSQRSGQITIADKSVLIQQEGGCTYTVMPTSQNYAAAGGMGTANVTTTGNCSWLASSNVSWITITSGGSLNKPGQPPLTRSGKSSVSTTGNGSVSYTVAANTGPARTGTMDIAGTLFTVTQASGCPINITPANLSAATVGMNYSQQLSQSGGVGSVNWTISSGSLPSGMMLDQTSGLLSGAPSITGNFSFTVRATDSGNCFGEIPYMLTVSCPTLSITPASLNSGVVGTMYSQALTLNGGSGSINWTVNSGTLPVGLNLDLTSGVLSGIPQAQGTSNFTVRATVSATGCFVDKSYSLTINCPTITIDQATINTGNLGVPYSQQFTQTGASGNITWTISSGSLPSNLTLSTSGLLSGTPVASGSFPITVRATAGNNCFGERNYTLVIGVCPTINITPATVSNGLINTNYNQQLTASGGSGGYNFTFTGNLPSGVTLSSSGLLSGTPTVVGTFHFTVTATDQSGCSGTNAYALVICSQITVNPATLPNGTVGSTYSQNVSAVGGDIPHSFTFSGTLPTGVTLANDGLLSGVPTQVGTFTFTVTATDTSSCTGSQSYTVTINPAGLMFYPLPRPLRILDTRPGQSACDTPGQQIPGGTSRLQTAAGRTCDSISIPASARALTGNITTVLSGGGFLTLYPSDAMQPTVANSNYQANQVLNNVFTVGLGAADGAFKIFVTTNTDVVIDITGYYAPPDVGGLYFHPLPTPVRMLDTRAGQPGCDTPGAPIAAGVERTQQGRIFCNGVTIPSSAAAIVGNATAVVPSGQGFLTLYPSNAPSRPLAASSNYAAGQNMNAPFTVGLAPNGTFNIYSSQTTDLVIDVLGYYSPDAVDLNGTGLLFNPLPRPVRLLETRMGQPGCYTTGTPLAAGSTRIQQARGTCDGMTVSATAQAIVGNATAVFPASNGFLTFWSSDAAQPGTANSNYQAAKVFNRHITVGLGADGAFKIFTSAVTDLVIDVSGYFAP